MLLECLRVTTSAFLCYAVAQQSPKKINLKCLIILDWESLREPSSSQSLRLGSESFGPTGLMARPRQAQRHARPPPRQVRQVRAAGATRIPAPRSWSRPQSPSWTGEATAACREYWPDHGSTELQCRLSCQRGIIDRYIRSSTARRRVAGKCTRASGSQAFLKPCRGGQPE